MNFKSAEMGIYYIIIYYFVCFLKNTNEFNLYRSGSIIWHGPVMANWAVGAIGVSIPMWKKNALENTHEIRLQCG